MVAILAPPESSPAALFGLALRSQVAPALTRGSGASKLGEARDMTRKFEIEAGKFLSVGTAEYQEMLEDYRDNMIDSQDIEPGDFAWEFRHEIIEEILQTIRQ
jgi:hypothetical protein